MMSKEINEERQRFLSMRKQATEHGYLDPPPFSDYRMQIAWATGYRNALSDIARGRIDVR